MAEYLLDDERIFNAGNDFDRAFALFAFIDIHAEHLLEPSCPSHVNVFFYRCAIIRFNDGLLSSSRAWRE
jgi:hypothetical protein